MADANNAHVNKLAAYAMVIAEAIQELGEVPNGHLYAQVMGKLDIHSYNEVIATLKRCRLVTETGHLLKWVGPPKSSPR